MLDGRGSIPGGGEIFHIRPEQDWGPHNLLHNWYQILTGGKSSGARRSPPTLLWAGLYENRIPAVDEIFHARRIRNCGFSFIGYRDFNRVKPQERGVDQKPHLAPSLMKELSSTSTPLWDFVACSMVKFNFSLKHKSFKN